MEWCKACPGCQMCMAGITVWPAFCEIVFVLNAPSPLSIQRKKKPFKTHWKTILHVDNGTAMVRQGSGVTHSCVCLAHRHHPPLNITLTVCIAITQVLEEVAKFPSSGFPNAFRQVQSILSQPQPTTGLSIYLQLFTACHFSPVLMPTLLQQHEMKV